MDATAWPLHRWPLGRNVPTLRSGATSAGRRHVAAVHTILQPTLNLVVDWVKVRTVCWPQTGMMKSGVSWVNRCTVSCALWAGRLSAWLQYVTLYWKLKYFVVNIRILITRVINNIFCRRYIHNQEHTIWLRCVRIWHFNRTLSRVTVFSWTQSVVYLCHQVLMISRDETTVLTTVYALTCCTVIIANLF